MAQRLPLSQDELNVIVAMRQDSRVKHTDLARRYGWPVSTAHERAHRCADRHVKRNTCLLDFKALGYSQRSVWIVKPARREEWLAAILRLPQLNTLCRSHSGEFLVESVCRDEADEAQFKAMLGAGAVILSSHPVVEALKQESAFSTLESLSVLRPKAA